MSKTICYKTKDIEEKRKIQTLRLNFIQVDSEKKKEL